MSLRTVNTQISSMRAADGFHEVQGISLMATPFLLAIAQSLALARSRWHDGYRKPDQCIGNADRSRDAEFSGTLAEVIAVAALEAEGFFPVGFEPFTLRPSALADFSLDGYSFDVKAVSLNNAYLTINEEKRIAYQQAGVRILPVRFSSTDRALVLRPVTAEQVGTWQLRHGHSPYRSVHVDSLRVLSSWAELTEEGVA